MGRDHSDARGPEEVARVEAEERARRREQDDAAKHAEQRSVESEMAQAHSRDYAAKRKIDALLAALRVVIEDDDARDRIGRTPLADVRDRAQRASDHIVAVWD
jgi:hypothetical protein